MTESFPRTETPRETAARYKLGGLSPIAIRADGSKKPTGRWEGSQEKIATDSQLAQKFPRSRIGIAIVCGAVSGNLEVLDFDNEPVHAQFVAALSSEARVVLEKTVRVKTPARGYHYYYRREHANEGNKKLALRKGADGKVETLIETRGEGGYVIAPGSHIDTHESHKPYVVEQGDLCNIPVVTEEERDLLISTARSLTEYVPDTKTITHHPHQINGEQRPGDHYNSDGDVIDRVAALLRNHGWKQCGHSTKGQRWMRPDGTRPSATMFDDGSLYVFSTSTGLESDRRYSPFALFAALEHAGDFAAAARTYARSAGLTSHNQPQPSSAKPELRDQENDSAGNHEQSGALTRAVFHASERKIHIQPAECLVRGVVYRNQTTILEGLSGSGKSTTTVDIIATASQRFKVLLITNESPEEYDARLDAWCAFHQRELPGLYMLTETAGLFDPVRIEALIETASRLGGVDLFVIDVLSNEFAEAGRDETNEHMAIAFRAVSVLTRSQRAGAIVVTHTGWSGEHTRGGSYSHGSARRVLKIENTDGVITVRVVKSNVKREENDKRFRIIQVSTEKLAEPDFKRLEEYVVLVPASCVTDDTGPLSPRQSELLMALAEPLFRDGARFGDLESHLKCAKSTLSTATNALMRRGLAQKTKNGLILLTDNGLEVISVFRGDTRKTTELASDQSGLNWQLEPENSSDVNALVRDGSMVVQSQFSGPVRSVRSLSPLLGERTNELSDLNRRNMEGQAVSNTGCCIAEQTTNGL